MGYSEEWINQRIKTIEIRKALTDEWKRGGMDESRDYASLTDIISRAWSGMTTRQYKEYKGLRKESLRDNMNFQQACYCDVKDGREMVARVNTKRLTK